MAATATVRDLRNHFPKVRKLVETEGEVVVTEQGTPKYRLTRFTPVAGRKAPAPKDYLSRLRRHQPRPSSAAAARALDEANRGAR
jgi:antitoxin (DNA-binding transcriptional repressor) of toxin-antitoxin stability system